MQDEKDESIDWIVSLLHDQTRFQQLPIFVQMQLKASTGIALIGLSSSAFAATRSLVQLQKAARLLNEVWNHFSKQADDLEKDSYVHWRLAGSGILTFCNITISYCDLETNDPAYVLQVLGENGSKLREWHGCHAN